MIIPYKMCLKKMAAPAGNYFYDFKGKLMGQTGTDKENWDIHWKCWDGHCDGHLLTQFMLFSLAITQIGSYIELRKQMLYRVSVTCLNLTILSVLFYITNHESSWSWHEVQNVPGVCFQLHTYLVTLTTLKLVLVHRKFEISIFFVTSKFIMETFSLGKI